jgi:hypothetical protein
VAVLETDCDDDGFRGVCQVFFFPSHDSLLFTLVW